MIYMLIILPGLFFLIFISGWKKKHQWFYKLTVLLMAVFIGSSAFAGATDLARTQKGRPTEEYVILMTSIALAYGVFLIIRARRRKRSRIFLQYGRSEFTP